MAAKSTRHRFTGSQTLIYPEHGVIAEPGSEHDWPDGAPADGQWEPIAAPAPAPKEA